MGDNPANPFNAEVEIGKMSVQLDNQDDKLDHIVEKLDGKEFVPTAVFQEARENLNLQLRSARELAQAEVRTAQLKADAAEAKADAAAAAVSAVQQKAAEEQAALYKMILGAYGAVVIVLIAGAAAAYFLKAMNVH